MSVGGNAGSAEQKKWLNKTRSERATWEITLNVGTSAGLGSGMRTIRSDRTALYSFVWIRAIALYYTCEHDV